MMSQDNSAQTQNLPYLGKYSESTETLKTLRSFSLENMYGTSYASIDALSARTDSDVTQSMSLPAGWRSKHF